MVTVKVWAGLLPQELSAVTVISPPVVPEVTLMDVVPCPEFMVQPLGTVQVYVVASVTSEMLYTNPLVEGGTGEGVDGVIAPGWAGVGGFTITSKVEGVKVEVLNGLGPLQEAPPAQDIST